MKKAVFLVVFFLIVACGAIRVNYDYASETNFSAYKTYNYYPDIDTGLSELDTKRLLRAVDSVLEAKGIFMAENPDFFVNIHSVSYRNNPNSAVGVGMGGTGRNVGGGVSVGIPLGSSGMSMILSSISWMPKRMLCSGRRSVAVIIEKMPPPAQGNACSGM